LQSRPAADVADHEQTAEGDGNIQIGGDQSGAVVKDSSGSIVAGGDSNIIDYGWTNGRIDIRNYREVGWFARVVDYDPTDALTPRSCIGDHYHIMKRKDDSPDSTYVLQYRSIGQRAFMGPGHIAAEGFFPIPTDLAQYLLNRGKREGAGKSPPSRDVTSGGQEGGTLEAVIISVMDWLVEQGPKLERNFSNHTDIVHDLQEMIDAANIGAFRASLAMAGRVLEQLLNHMMAIHELPLRDGMGVGKKIKSLREGGVYLDAGLSNVHNLINVQRIIGVHANEKVPIPSEDQAVMVIFAVKDSVNRFISATDNE
jgi:hypothetical protein